MNVIPPQVSEFLTENSMATLATIGKEIPYPWMVPIFYIADRKSHLYFLSHKQSKKFQNILIHPEISLSITDPQTLDSLQIHATAAVDEQYDHQTEIVAAIMKVSNEHSDTSFPPVMKSEEDMELIHCTIRWFRLSRFLGRKPDVLEGEIE